MNTSTNLQSQPNSIFSITAYNKRENRNNLYQIIGLSFLSVAMMIVSAIVFRNLITAVALLVCSLALLLYYLQKPSAIVVRYDDKRLSVNGEEIQWDNIVAWDMIEYQSLTEIYVVTSKLTNTYISFYINKANFHDYNRFLDYMYQYADFQKELAYSSSFQNFLRIVGLK